MAVSTVLPHITATYSGVYPASTIVGTIPVISNNSVRTSILVYLSPIDAQLTLQFSPTVDIGGTFGSVTIPSTPLALYDGVEFTYTFSVTGNVQAAATAATAWTTAIVTVITTAITGMRTTDASITFPAGSSITTV